MRKKFIVRLTEEERESLRDITKQRKGSREKVRRADILLMADADGPNWNDGPISEAFKCSVQTVENVRRRFVTDGFEQVVNGIRRQSPPTPKKLDGRQEAEIIALRLGVPPKGFSTWSLRLLASKAVELEITESVSHETVRRTLKKTGLLQGRSTTG